MVLKLIELQGQHVLRPSPSCWCSRMALAQKGLEADLIPIQFGEKQKVAFSGQKLVPVLLDDEQVVSDSWAIACYLEDAYPDRLSLFGGETGRAGAKFINSWTDRAIHPTMLNLMICDIHDHAIMPSDQAYFRATREKRFDMSLEDYCDTGEACVEAFRKKMVPVRHALGDMPYLAGAEPAYADYIFFRTCKFMDLCSKLVIFSENDPIFYWHRRMLGLFDGTAVVDSAA